MDTHMTEACLWSFLHAHLQINGVAYNIHVGRLDAGEYVSVVPVEVTHGIVILAKSFVHEFLVIDISFLQGEQFVQTIGSINSVAHPFNVTDVVFLSFLHLDIDIHMLIIIVPNTVSEDGSITVAIFVVFGDQVLLVLFPPLGGVLLLFQEC
jgi:hypothetical protein